MSEDLEAIRERWEAWCAAGDYDWDAFPVTVDEISCLFSEVTRLTARVAVLVEALEAEEDVQNAAAGCETCTDEGAYCEPHMEQALKATTKRRAALAAAKQVMGRSQEGGR